jgi:hypothetical protein
VPVRAFAIERRTGRNDNRFNESPVVEPKKKFLSGVHRPLPPRHAERADRVVSTKPLTQRAAEVRHPGHRRHSFPINPLENLPRSKPGFTGFSQRLLKLRRQHAGQWANVVHAPVILAAIYSAAGAHAFLK